MLSIIYFPAVGCVYNGNIHGEKRTSKHVFRRRTYSLVHLSKKSPITVCWWPFLLDSMCETAVTLSYYGFTHTHTCTLFSFWITVALIRSTRFIWRWNCVHSKNPIHHPVYTVYIPSMYHTYNLRKLFNGYVCMNCIKLTCILLLCLCRCTDGFFFCLVSGYY